MAIALVVPVLPVRDLTRAKNFYRRLGFAAHSWQNGDVYAFIQRDGHELHLARSDKLTGNESPSAAYFYLVKGTAAVLGQFVGKVPGMVGSQTHQSCKLQQSDAYLLYPLLWSGELSCKLL